MWEMGWRSKFLLVSTQLVLWSLCWHLHSEFFFVSRRYLLSKLFYIKLFSLRKILQCLSFTHLKKKKAPLYHNVSNRIIKTHLKRYFLGTGMYHLKLIHYAYTKRSVAFNIHKRHKSHLPEIRLVLHWTVWRFHKRKYVCKSSWTLNREEMLNIQFI